MGAESLCGYKRWPAHAAGTCQPGARDSEGVADSGGPSKGSQSMPALLRALFGLHTLGLPSCSLPY